MYVEIPHVRVGEPMRCGGLTVFPLATGLPLFQYDESVPDYALAQAAIAVGTLIVREVSEEGSVCELITENLGDQPVLFVEGEELTGAKQNRAVSTSVMVAAKSQTRIPVCCVQRGKWTYSSRQFSPGSCCPPTLRHLLKRSGEGIAVVQRQQAVWQEVRRKHQTTGTVSAQENLSDTLETHRDRVDDLRGLLPYSEGASGIMVVLGGKVVAADVFDKPATLEKLWDRLVQGVALDALEFCGTGCQGDDIGEPVRLYKEMVRNMRWQRVESVGLGEAYHARGDDDSLATALVVDGVPIHVSMSMPTMD